MNVDVRGKIKSPIIRKIILVFIFLVPFTGILVEGKGVSDLLDIDELVLRGYDRTVYGEITILGRIDFNSKTIEALKYLEERDNEHFQFIKRNISKIEFSKITGVNIPFRTLYVGKPYKSNMTWYASIMIHDACHVDLSRRGVYPYGEDAERTCMEKQNDFFRNVGYPLLDIEDSLKTRYWEIHRDY